MIASALGPVFLLILTGALLRRLDFPGATFWPGIERLTYYIAFPALLVHRLALAEFSEAAFPELAAVIVGALLITGGLTWLLRPLVSANGPDFTSVFQGGIRFNTYIGLAVASSLYGDAGLVVAAIAVSLMIPLVNILSVLNFALVNGGSRPDPFRLLTGIASNPLIVACLLGVALNVTHIGLPGWTAETLARLGAAALPLGLLAVGVALRPGTVGKDWRAIVSASVLKFVVFPALVLGLALWWQLDMLSRQILVLLACLPTATSAYILARQLGGNAVMMANIISVQSLLAFIIMPPWLILTGAAAG